MAARCILDTYPDRMFEGRIEDVGSVAARAAGVVPSRPAAKPASRCESRSRGATP